MMTFLIWTLVALALAIAFWIAHLVRDINERFDQIEQKLDVIIFQLDSSDPRKLDSLSPNGLSRREVERPN
jgi:hypothetical protein